MRGIEEKREGIENLGKKEGEDQLALRPAGDFKKQCC